MKFYFAGLQRYASYFREFNPKYVLESFAYLKQKEYEKFRFEEFLLDSGAFTFLSRGRAAKEEGGGGGESGGTEINWTAYVKKYAEFINYNRIERFFELDIYKLIGTPRTEDLRKLLEDLTGRQCLPVWHRHLGLEYLHRLAEEYGYIGFGGFALKNIRVIEYKFIPPLLDVCRKNNCRVHGLGFTNRKGLDACKFDSVDSTSWNGGRFGTLYVFKNGKMEYCRRPGKRIKVGDSIRHNFGEWMKFQRYAESFL